MKYYKKTNNELFVDPIVKNHEGLIEITESEFNKQLAINNTPTDAQLLQQKVNEAKAYLAKTDFKMTIDYYDTMTTEEQLDLVTLRATARAFVIANEV